MHAIAVAQNNATASSAVRVAVDLAKDVFELTFAAASGASALVAPPLRVRSTIERCCGS